MNRKEITNSQDYKATKIALDWWYSLPEEQRKATDIDAEPDIVDAYSDGVLYGWNNPNWISVEDQLPPFTHPEGASVKNTSDYVLVYNGYMVYISRLVGGEIKWWEDNRDVHPTHWMPIVPCKKGGEQ